MSFIGRERELNTLEEIAKQKGFRMLVLYGRRRIGKTRLLAEFVKNRKAVFFTGVENQADRNLELLSKAIYRYLGLGTADLPPFQTLLQALDFLTKQGPKNKNIIFVIDEYPYFVKAIPEAASLLQQFIDTRWNGKNLFLILSGSSVSYMQDEVLSAKSPIYGRRTAQLKLEALDYLASARFIPHYHPEEQLLMYAVTGGVPKYLELFDKKKSVHENVADLFFSGSGYMFEEPENLLKQELREVAVHNAVIESIANGAGRMNEITTKTGLDTAAVSYSLKTLIKLGIVRKEHAITDEKNRKKTHYEIADGMFRFWYRFVPDAMEMIAMGEGRQYYENQVKPLLSDFLGKVFENVSGEYLMKKMVSEAHPAVMTHSGRWWGTDPVKKEEAEVDIVCVHPGKKEAVIGECKYREEGIRAADVEKLMERSRLIRGYHVLQYVFFSKRQVSQAVKARCTKNALWVTLQDLYRQL